MYLKDAVLGSILVLLLFVSAEGDIEKDNEKCGNQLAGLTTCLPYVSGEAKTPHQGLLHRQVLKDSRECVCILIKDRDDPSPGLKINATLALSLPAKCDAPLDQSVTDCPSSSSATNSTAADQKSDGGVKRRWLGTMVSWVLLAMAVLHIFINL